MKERLRGELAVEQISERQRLKTVDALADLRRDIDSIALAAEDLSARIIKLSPILLQQIAKGEHEAAQRTAGQIHMLSRLIEQKVIICLERWRTGLTVADASLIQVRKPQYKRALKLKQR
jgi:hypothetical protein